MLGTILVISCMISVIMLIWFKSDAVLDYGKLLKLDKFLGWEDYRNERFNNPFLTYPIFLKTRLWYNRFARFFFNLIGCRLCSNIWMSMLGGFFISSSFVAFIGYTSVLSIISLFIYGHIAKLLDENK